MTQPQRSGQPLERMTRLCAVMVDALEAHPEYDDSIRCAITVTDGEQGGMVILGYDTDMQAVHEVLKHLRAMAAMNGIKLMLVDPVSS